MFEKYISHEEKELRARIRDLEAKKQEIARQLSSYADALKEKKRQEEEGERKAAEGKFFSYDDRRWRVSTHKDTEHTQTFLFVLGEAGQDYAMRCLVVTESIIEELDVPLFALIYGNGEKSTGEPERIIDGCREIRREDFLREYRRVLGSFEASLKQP